MDMEISHAAVGMATLIYHMISRWGVPHCMMIRKHFEFIILADGFQAAGPVGDDSQETGEFQACFWWFWCRKSSKLRREGKARWPHAGRRHYPQQTQKSIQQSAMRAFIEVQKEFGSLTPISGNSPVEKTTVNSWKTMKEIPRTQKPDASKDLLKRGFKFVGSTICYAYMQAAGMHGQ